MFSIRPIQVSTVGLGIMVSPCTEDKSRARVLSEEQTQLETS